MHMYLIRKYILPFLATNEHTLSASLQFSTYNFIWKHRISLPWQCRPGILLFICQFNVPLPRHFTHPSHLGISCQYMSSQSPFDSHYSNNHIRCLWLATSLFFLFLIVWLQRLIQKTCVYLTYMRFCIFLSFLLCFKLVFNVVKNLLLSHVPINFLFLLLFFFKMRYYQLDTGKMGLIWLAFEAYLG